MKRLDMVRSIGVVLAASALAVASPAAAQVHDSVAAQALFDQGKKLMAEGKASEACPKFAESQRLDPGVGTLLNLAACFEASNRNASAWSTFLEGESAARAEGNAEAGRVARERADALLGKLSKLTINVTQPNIAGLEVRRDETSVGQAQWRLPIPTDPGLHHIRASAPGRKDFQFEVEVKGASAVYEVTVPDLELDPATIAPPAPAPSPPAAAPPPAIQVAKQPPLAEGGAPQSAEGSHGGRHALAIGVGVVGVAGVALGTVFGLKSKAKHDEAKSHCLGSDCDSTGVQLRRDALSAGNLSTVSFVVGAVGLAGGALLWFTGNSTSAEAQSGTQVGLGFGRVVVEGRF